MGLTLKIVKSYPGGEPQGTTKTFDSRQTTLGRGADNNWVLPDPFSHLSRRHCEITRANNTYTLVDKSRHGVFLNGAPQKVGSRSEKLKDGDRLTLGGYELLVRLDSPAAAKIRELDVGQMADPIRPSKIAVGKIPKNWMDDDGEQPVSRAQQEHDESVEEPPPPPAGFEAFLRGAGIESAQLSKTDPTASLRRIGETYRLAIEGLFEILQARDQFRGEFRVERTKVRAKGNNPLKFSPDGEEALLKMIVQEPGFIPAPDAMREALKDIKADQVALIAAIQVALTRLLAQIDPDKLKKRLQKRGVLSGLMPGAWKARSWELYEEIHAELARELADDFHGAFGKAFAEAYEAFVRKK